MLCCLLAAAVVTEATDGPLLDWQYEGSAAQGARFTKVMEDRRVQELLLEVAAEAREEEFVSGALKRSAATAEEPVFDRLSAMREE
jgi:hypothetical protein